MTCFLVNISGFVQGVFFRYSAKKEAEKLNLFGYAKNLDNGSVEILVCGEKEKIEQFLKWCKSGSSTAKVERVDAKQIEFQKFSTFEIL